MAQRKFEVLYRDGRTVQVLCTANALYDAEERFGGVTDLNGLRATMFTAWASLRDAGKEAADFDTWRRELMSWVEDLGEEAVTDKDVDPTQADTSSTGSAGFPS